MYEKIYGKMYENILTNDAKVVPFNEDVCYNKSGSVICGNTRNPLLCK